MKVCVCGGRDYDDQEYIFSVLDDLHAEKPITLLIQGAQKRYDKELKRYVGADYHAKMWAKSRKVPFKEFKADWDKYGRSAGPKRNEKMAKESGMQLCVAFPRENGTWGNGTVDMIGRARQMNVPVILEK